MTRLAKTGLILMLLLLIGACSSTTFLYNRLDFLIPWYLDDYVELDASQSETLDSLLAPLLDWHRREELPRYRDLLDRIIASLDEPATADTIASFAADMEAAWFRLETEAVERALTLGADLSDAQIQEFLEGLEKDQVKYEKKYLKRDRKEYRKDAYESLLDNAQDYLGRLNRAQKSLTEDTAAGMQRSDSVWLRERAVWIERLRQLLRREPGWQQAVRDSLAARDESVAADYTETLAHNTALVRQWMAELLNSRTDKQDRRLRKKLDNLREDLQTLIDEPA